MLHIRVVSPADRTEDVSRALMDHVEVANLVVLPAAARKPSGDVVTCDVTREAANEVIDLLDRLDVDVRGSVIAERVDLALGSAFPGGSERDEAVVWEELQQRVDESSRLGWAYLAFLIIAVLIAAIGILQDSPVLIVGAMVLGPEFGPVAALCFAILRRRVDQALRALRTLVLGFLAAMVITVVCSVVLYHVGWVDPATLTDIGREARFIVKPDRWSFIVALLAGVAGVLSLTSDKSQTLVGVFISVATVPAASYAALATGLGRWSEVGPSLQQLAVNLTGMSIAGLLTLTALRFVWGKAGLRIRLVHGHGNR